MTALASAEMGSMQNEIKIYCSEEHGLQLWLTEHKLLVLSQLPAEAANNSHWSRERQSREKPSRGPTTTTTMSGGSTITSSGPSARARPNWPSWARTKATSAGQASGREKRQRRLISGTKFIGFHSTWPAGGINFQQITIDRSLTYLASLVEAPFGGPTLCRGHQMRARAC